MLLLGILHQNFRLFSTLSLPRKHEQTTTTTTDATASATTSYTTVTGTANFNSTASLADGANMDPIAGRISINDLYALYHKLARDMIARKLTAYE